VSSHHSMISGEESSLISIKSGCSRLSPGSVGGQKVQMMQMLLLPFIPIMALVAQNASLLSTIVASLSEAHEIQHQVTMDNLTQTQSRSPCELGPFSPIFKKYLSITSSENIRIPIFLSKWLSVAHFIIFFYYKLFPFLKSYLTLIPSFYPLCHKSVQFLQNCFTFHKRIAPISNPKFDNFLINCTDSSAFSSFSTFPSLGVKIVVWISFPFFLS